MAKANKDLSFENKVKRLEEIVSKIEASDVELEDSIQLFEEGVSLSKDCQDLLDKAEQKVKILISENGSAQLKDFND